MIKVAFLLNYPTSYKGALNYFSNLFFAIDKYLSNEVEVNLFIPDNISQEYIDLFSPYAKIIKTNILTRRSPNWVVDKIGEKLFDNNYLLDKLLVKHNIDVVSHSSYISKKIRTVNWVMDFQHLHFADLWTIDELKMTKKFLNRLIIKSDRIFLSSHSAFDDFKIEYQNLANKVHVLHFVCQPQGELKMELNTEDKKHILQKYNINQSFFYLPNQFWSHKNHYVVFEAIKILKDQNYNPLLVTSGLMNDFRNKQDHIARLKCYIDEHNLSSNIFLLGLIPYNDVLNLIIESECVINPSLFEGWSSTVEESKTMGKRLILSDISVHKEQKPMFGVYFNPTNAAQLADIMKDVINKNLAPPHIEIDILKQDLEKRTQIFATDFLNGVAFVR